jgi:hypothetical protein
MRTLADDWVLIAEGALQDDVGTKSVRIYLGGGYNYVSTLPVQATALVYPLCDNDASVLTTSSPSLPDYVILTVSSWPYPDTNPLAVNETINDIDITPILTEFGLAFTRLADLGRKASIELSTADHFIHLLNTDIPAISLLPNDVTITSLTNLLPVLDMIPLSDTWIEDRIVTHWRNTTILVVGPNGTLIEEFALEQYTTTEHIQHSTPKSTITINDMINVIQQYLFDVIVQDSDSSAVNDTFVTVDAKTIRQGTMHGYTTRYEFGIVASRVLQVTDISPSSEHANFFHSLNVTMRRGFNVDMDSSFLLNFTVVITDDGDVRLEVRNLRLETVPRYQCLILITFIPDIMYHHTYTDVV